MKKLLLVFVLVAVLSISITYLQYEKPSEEKQTNYIGLVYLGLAPNSPTREPTTRDIDTGVLLRHEDNIFRLYESRTWDTLDYGKFFVVEVA